MDRIDIHIDVPAVKYKAMMTQEDGEPSGDILNRVNVARRIQLQRFAGTDIYCNAQMGAKKIKEVCVIDSMSQSILKAAVEKLGLSARAHEKVLKVGRTIADLAHEDDIKPEHIAEAVQLRSLDRETF